MSKTAPALVQGMTAHVQRTAEVLNKIDLDAVADLVDKLYSAYLDRRRVFIFGNGGSGATASHFAEDLAKSPVGEMSVQKRLRVLSLTDNAPFITALGNDWGYDTVFREQLVTLAEEGDVAIAISGSGNSPNVVNAVKWAGESGLYTVGMTGFNGGKLKGMVDLSIHCGVLDMEIAENAHTVVMHLAVGGLRTLVQEAP